MPEASPAAVLLDLDDTILEYGPSEPCWRRVCASFAPRLGGVAPGALVAAIRRVADVFWSEPERARLGRLDLRAARRRIVAAALGELGLPASEVAGELADAFTEEREAGVRPFPDALPALEALRGRGVRLVLVTNGAAAAQRRKVERFGLAPYFDCVVIEGEFGVGKPDPRVYRHARRARGAAPASALMAGDNLEFDVLGPQRVGLLGVWVDRVGAGVPAASPVRPDRTIRSLSELL